MSLVPSFTIITGVKYLCLLLRDFPFIKRVPMFRRLPSQSDSGRPPVVVTTRLATKRLVTRCNGVCVLSEIVVEPEGRS